MADSEYEFRHRNAAMAYLMQSYGNFDNEVEQELHNYFSNCALRMSCVDLAKSFNFLSNKGFCSISNEQIISEQETRQVNALMATSGMYDEAGSFAFQVGLPGKSVLAVALLPLCQTDFLYAFGHRH